MNCICCQRFPPLGLLPFLKKLEISGFHKIVRIDGDFHGNNSSSFKSLETLIFSNMRLWEKWDCQDVKGAFPCLRQLSIEKCPKLKGQLPKQVVPLEKLQIGYCQELEGSAPSTVDLEVRDCGKLQLEWAKVRRLKIGGHKTLDDLGIYSLKKSIREMWDLCFAPCTFPLDFFETLTTLEFSRCGNLRMISQDVIHNNLKHLQIIKCHNLQSLPKNMPRVLPYLRSLWIKDCPTLGSFTRGGLPSNLEELRIIKCSRLVESLKDAFGDSSSLKSLRIEEVDAECFPDKGLLPLSLTSLYISHCPNLEKLNCPYQLSSLQSLRLFNCPNLQRLPEEGLPKSISCLEIYYCPLLKQQRCQEEGED